MGQVIELDIAKDDGMITLPTRKPPENPHPGIGRAAPTEDEAGEWTQNRSDLRLDGGLQAWLQVAASFCLYWNHL